MKNMLSNLMTLLKRSYQEWQEDSASRLAAALAYYTTFSIAPMLVLVIAITGLLWQADAVRAQILDQIRGLAGAQGAEFISGLIDSTGTRSQNILATILGIITLLFGALGVFNQLHTSLNLIWNIEEKKTKGLLPTLKKLLIDRLLSFTMILGIGFLLLVSLVISTALSALQGTIGNLLPFSEFLLQIVNLVVSLAVSTLLFALMFKILPDVKIEWRDVWLGAFVTAVLFSIGKMVIGIYLGNSNVASSYGAAGSLILLLLWIYYSAQILFFGAEFTQVYATRHGSKTARDLSSPPARPAPAVVSSSRASQLEAENRQTARALLAIVLTSFFTGVFATIFGLRKKG